MLLLCVLLYSLLKNLLLALVRLLTMAARKLGFLCRLINERINSKSTTMDASIIAIIYCHLLCVNYLLGTRPVGSTEQGEKFSVALKKKIGCVELKENERNIKGGTFSVGVKSPCGKGRPHIVCLLISPAALLIRSFTVEYSAKGNLVVFEGMVGRKTKERQVIQINC